MTDQPTTYSDSSEVTLTIDAARGWGKPGHVSVSIDGEGMQIPSDFGLFIPTARLLAMIDTEDPDAMRAYYRETIDPERMATLEQMLPADLAAEAARFRPHVSTAKVHTTNMTADEIAAERLEAIPEADSPEDIDERPDREDPTERAQLDRAWALERVVTLFSAGIGTTRAVEVADWILGPEAATVEVLTLSGEDLNR